MGIFDQTRFVERMKFFDGQRLFAADLQALEAFNREMRWLHNQSLHQPGIGRGYAVSGEKGEREVTIAPGYAIDSFGREIVLTKLHTMQVPPVSSDEKGRSVFYDLTVAYQDTDLEEIEFRDGLCDTRGVIRLREAPVFCWVRLERDDAGQLHPSAALGKDIREGRKIILARVEVLNCQLQQVISIVQRQSALPECGPYISCGTAMPTSWVEQGDDGNREGTFIMLQAVIDTRAGGFRITPCYSAHIPGPRMVQIDIRDDVQGLVLLLDFLRILDTRPDQFTVLLLVILERLSTSPQLSARRRRRVEGELVEEAAAGEEARNESPTQKIIEWIKANWQVTWMGVEG